MIMWPRISNRRIERWYIKNNEASALGRHALSSDSQGARTPVYGFIMTAGKEQLHLVRLLYLNCSFWRVRFRPTDVPAC